LESALRSRRSLLILREALEFCKRGWTKTRLSDHLELTKLRLSSSPSPLLNDKDERSLAARTSGFAEADTKPDEAVKQFTTFLNPVPGRERRFAFRKAVFYQLIHSCDWAAQMMQLSTFIVVEDRFDISLDPDSHELVFHQTQQRGPVRQVINIPLLAASKAGGSNQITVKSTKAPSADAFAPGNRELPERVLRRGKQAAHLKDPEFSYEPQEPDYLGMESEGREGTGAGIRQVLGKAGNLIRTPSRRPTGKSWFVYLSGEYASGDLRKATQWMMITPPIDEAKLRDFTGNLLRSLQDHLARSSP